MKNNKVFGLKISLLLLALTFGFQQIADAQTTPKSRTTKTSKKKTGDYFDESGGFKHRLMYGLQADQGFLSLFGSSFQVGIDPLVGYKLTDWAALGVVTGIRYNSDAYGIQGSNQIVRVNALSYSYGAFARAKFMKNVFAHFEYRNVSHDRFNGHYDPTTFKGQTNHYEDGQGNLGLGYTSGNGGWSYEFMVLYNVLYTDNKISNYNATPFNVKIGFVYNF
jgi:hypothetical protein